jgi:CheY-like chemotaxis protein
MNAASARTAVAPTASAVPPPLPNATAAMSDTSSTPMPHVLYLDDDDTLVFLVRRLLERRGFRVTAFTSQSDAIEAVRADPQAFDLLLTDYNMPGMSGLDVARAVLALQPSLTVAVASGYITDEMQAEAKAAGVREVVFKTDAVETFCEVVSRLVQPAA